MTEELLIQEFMVKQGFETWKRIDDSTWAFDGFFFDADDIAHDMAAEVTPGRIKLFAAEGRDSGKMPAYRDWLMEHFYF